MIEDNDKRKKRLADEEARKKWVYRAQNPGKWDGITLEDWLYREFDAGRAGSEEVKALIPFFGRQRLEACYKKWREEKKK